MWSSNLIISAQVPGRVIQIPVTIWSQVKQWNLLLKLEDYGWSYLINAARAANNIQSAQISYTTAITNLQKQSQDANIMLEDSNFKLEKTKSDIQAQEAKIQLDRTNANLSNTWSNANWQLKQLQLQLEKSMFDFQAKKQADSQTIENFINTYQVLIRDLNLLYENVIDETDKILWSRIQTQNLNDIFEPYLWAKNSTSKLKADSDMLQVINYQNTYKQILEKTITVEELTPQLKLLLDGLKKINILLISVNTMLINSVSASSFPQSQLDSMIGNINNLQTQVQNQMNSITMQQNTIQSFLSTYQAQQESIQKSLESLQQQYENTSKNLTDGQLLTDISTQRQEIALEQLMKWAELSLKQSENTNITTQKQKNNTLAWLSNTIKSAQIWYQEASNQLNKLTIVSPINGIIADVLVDIGQDVGIGTPLLRVVNNIKPQIEITLNKEELEFINMWSVVFIQLWNQMLTGVISSIGTVADTNFMIKAIIDVPDTVNNLWDLVDIIIPVESKNILLPLNIITLLNSQLGQITLWNSNGSGNTIVQEVKLGVVYDDLVEIQTTLADNVQIIISSLDTFNAEEQVLKPQTNP